MVTIYFGIAYRARGTSPVQGTHDDGAGEEDRSNEQKAGSRNFHLLNGRQEGASDPGRLVRKAFR